MRWACRNRTCTGTSVTRCAIPCVACRGCCSSASGRPGIGELEPGSGEMAFTDASHHMGTTRMSAAPADGVVDADCRVHGVRNLYVAGSSVFPSAGFANPTLSIVALSLRLARHLAAER